jgi:hypothetical protein
MLRLDVRRGVTHDPSLRNARAQARERITVPRREVANTIRFHRRKGTLSALEDLAEAVAGWPARAVEFYRLLAVTQNIDYLRMNRGRAAELRDGDALDAIGTAFDEMARNVDIRRTDSVRSRGNPNIQGVGVFLWRLRAYPVTRAPAYHFHQEAPHCYLFNALGHDTPLFVNPESAGADPALPMPITRNAFETREISETTGATASGVPFYYGANKSLMIWTGTPPVEVTADRIIPADLSDWRYRPRPGKVAVDPMRGRIAFPPNETKRQAVSVKYAYGFSADMGGGEYTRTLSELPGAKPYRVGAGATYARIGDALAQWSQDAPPRAVIEITDSGVMPSRSASISPRAKCWSCAPPTARAPSFACPSCRPIPPTPST